MKLWRPRRVSAGRTRSDQTMRTRNILLLAILTASPAVAFEVDHYKTGMSYNDAQSAARSSGHYLIDANGKDWQIYRTSRSNDERLAFCRNKLFGYTKPLDGLAAYIKVLAQKTKDDGRGEYQTSWYESPTPENSAHTLRILWRNGEDYFALTAQRKFQSDYYSASWSSENGCTPGPRTGAD